MSPLLGMGMSHWASPRDAVGPALIYGTNFCIFNLVIKPLVNNKLVDS